MYNPESPAYRIAAERKRRATRARTHKICSMCKESLPIDRFYLSNGIPGSRCKPCSKEYTRRYKAAHPEKTAKYQALTREWHKKNKRQQQEYGRFRHYGITPEQYLEMCRLQDGKCAICREWPLPHGKTKDLVVDHCHSSQAIRGLLCSRCNRAIGLLKENPATLRSAAAYLEEPPFPLELVALRRKPPRRKVAR